MMGMSSCLMSALRTDLPERWRICTMSAFLPFIEIRGASFLTNR